jgi:hypothetical protein
MHYCLGKLLSEGWIIEWQKDNKTPLFLGDFQETFLGAGG